MNVCGDPAVTLTVIPRNTVCALKLSIKISSLVEKMHSNSLTDDFMYIIIVWRLSWKQFSHNLKTAHTPVDKRVRSAHEYQKVPGFLVTVVQSTKLVN